MNTLKRTVYFCFCFLLWKWSAAQAPPVEWARCYGGSADDFLGVIEQTNDGGFVFVGGTRSMDGDISSAADSADIWVVKTNALGLVEWERSIGTIGYEAGRSIKQTPDGGYIVLGIISPETDFSRVTAPSMSILVVKLDASGAIAWQKTFGGSDWDSGWDIALSPDGGYIVIASTESTDGDISGNHGREDIWLLKLRENGEKQWSRCYGGPGTDYGYSISKATDGYFLAGFTDAKGGDIWGDGSDGWVVKVDLAGEVIWQKALGAPQYDQFFSVTATLDGGCIAGGESYNMAQGTWDYFLAKLDKNGNTIWQKTFGGESYDVLASIIQLADGTYLSCGVQNAHSGLHDIWITAYDQSGEILWEQNYGGQKLDYGSVVRSTEDGGFVIGGSTNSSDGQVNGNHGQMDIWVLKLSPGIPLISGERQTCTGAEVTFRKGVPYACDWYLDDVFLKQGDSLSQSFTEKGTHTLKACYPYKGLTQCDTHRLDVLSFPEIKLPDTLSACEPFSAQLCPGGEAGWTYVWDGGSADSCRSFTKSGPVGVTVANGPCKVHENLLLLELKNPVFTLIQQDTPCLDGSNALTLRVEPDTFPSVFWSDGSSGNVLLSKDISPRQVEVTGTNGCVLSKSIQPMDGCTMLYYLPTAFSPNGDGLNDTFLVAGSGIAEAKCKVFNRWGQLIFEGDGLNAGWDGTLNGEPAENGMYLVLMVLEPSNPFISNRKTVNHSIVLIR